MSIDKPREKYLGVIYGVAREQSKQLRDDFRELRHKKK